MTGVLVGLILGDANIRRPGKNGNPQIQFNQGLFFCFCSFRICFICIFIIISIVYSFPKPNTTA